jgi:hypothetical protein
MSLSEETLQIDGFISEDHKHVVRWEKASKDEPPTWNCITHNKPYYTFCILETESPKHSFNRELK